MKTSKKQIKNNSKQTNKVPLSLSHDILSNRKIVSPQKLKILVLSGNELNNDELQFLHKCINLIKLDLSYNRITKISKKVQLSNLPSLKVMQLHHNRIERIQGLQGIFDAISLVYLTLQGNSVMNLPKVQHLIVNMLPSLKLFNDRIISVQERSPNVLIEFRTFEVDTKMLLQWKSNSVNESYFMKVLTMQLNYIHNIWLWSNPIIKIQRKWRECLKIIKSQKKSVRKQLLRENENSIMHNEQKIQRLNIVGKFFEEWKTYTQNLRSVKEILCEDIEQTNKYYLTLRLEDYKLALRNLRLKKTIRRVISYIRERIMLKKMQKRIEHVLRIKNYNFNSNSSFYEISQIKITNRFLFNKNQKHLVDNFLANIGQNFNLKQSIQSTVSFGKVTEYLSIRMVDPETYLNKKIQSTLGYMMWPSMKCIFLKRRKYQRKPRSSLIKIKPLSYIKNINKVLTKEQVEKTIEVYKRIDKFMKVQYEESLIYLECKDQQVMKMLLRYIYYHNSKALTFPNLVSDDKKISLLQNYVENFVPYAERLLERTSAAVRIQQNWRRFINIRAEKQPLYIKLMRHRAALKIQRFFRDIKFFHRLRFHKNLQNQLKYLNGTSFLLHKHIYFIINNLGTSHNAQIFRNTQLIRNHTSIQIVWSIPLCPFPPHLVHSNFPNIPVKLKDSRQADCFQLLHMGSKVTDIRLCGQEFYLFTFSTVQEAKFRASLLALITYRIAKSRYIFPICPSNIERYNIILQMYHKYPQLSDLKQINFNQNQEKVTYAKVVNLSGLMLFTQSTNMQNQSNSIHIQFYQKKYRNFPIKFIGQIYYQILLEQPNQKPITPYQKQKQVPLTQLHRQKQSQDRSFIQKNSIKPFTNTVRNEEPYSATSKNGYRPETFQPNYLNINKVDKKRLSLYDMGFTSQLKRQVIEKKEKFEKLKVEKEQKSFGQSRRNWVEESHKASFYKKQLNLQNKRNEMVNLKQKVKKQRSQNETEKQMKQLQRTQILKRKTERVKEFKKRARSQKVDEEGDFIQQGNFVMEQQLKMIIMRNKIKQKESKEQLRRQYITSNIRKPKTFQSDSIDSKSQIPPKEINIKIDPDMEGEDREIRNTKGSYGWKTKLRKHSVGAYIRDPAFVHGVFPQQYYPIENRSQMKVVFPPL